MEGRLSGELDPASPMFSLDASWTEFGFSGIRLDGPATRLELSGDLDGTLTLGRRAPEVPRGKGSFRVSGCRAGVTDPLLNSLGIRELSFRSVDISLDVEDRNLLVREFKAVGTEMNILAEGRILLRNPVESSSLAIKGFLRPSPAQVKKMAALPSLSLLFDDANRQGIPFTLGGTLARPRISL
jgi:type II secretion system protein N